MSSAQPLTSYPMLLASPRDSILRVFFPLAAETGSGCNGSSITRLDTCVISLPLLPLAFQEQPEATDIEPSLAINKLSCLFIVLATPRQPHKSQCSRMNSEDTVTANMITVYQKARQVAFSSSLKCAISLNHIAHAVLVQDSQPTIL